MSWMILASIPPLVWAFSNHIDEYLSKHHFTTSPFLMIVAACVVQMPVGVALVAFNAQAFDYDLWTIIILNLTGILSILCFVPYIKALQIDGAGVAVPIYQVIPVFTFVMAWLVLGETVSWIKILAAVLIVGAAFAITWDFSKKSISYKTLYLMFLSSFGLALYNLFSRYYLSYKNVDTLSMLGWSLFGTGVFGIFVVLAHTAWRNDLRRILTKGGGHVSGLFMVQALLDMFAFGTFIAAMAIAPAAGLVSTMNGLQPFYVLIVGLMAAYFLPQQFQDKVTRQTLVWRIFCIMMLFIGVAILSLSE